MEGVHHIKNAIYPESGLTQQQVHDIYNGRYHEQHRENGITKGLHEDTIHQIFYPQKPGPMRTMESLVFTLLGSFTTLIPDNKKAYEETIAYIFELLKTKNVLLATNHATFVGILLLIRELQRYAKKM